MTFSLTKFKAYGIEADQVVDHYEKQVAVFSITAANTDVDLDIGDYTGTFWSAVGSSDVGSQALIAIKDINKRAESFLGVRGTSIAGYVQVDASRSSIVEYDSTATAGGSASQAVTVTGLLSTDIVTSVVQKTAGTGVGEVLVFNSAASAGGGTTEALTVTGLLATDTLLSATLSTKGANAAYLTGYSLPVGNGSLNAVFSADPGINAIVKVTVLRAGGNAVMGWTTVADNALTVQWVKAPGTGAVVRVTALRTTTAVDGGTYELAMDGTNAQLPNVLFTSGDAPTSYVLALEWSLLDGMLPVSLGV